MDARADNRECCRQQPWTHGGWWRRWGRRHAELAERRKLIAHICVLRERVKRFADSDNKQSPMILVQELLDNEKWCKYEDESLHVYADELEELLPLIADRLHLQIALAAELGGRNKEESIQLSALFDGATLNSLRNSVHISGGIDGNESESPGTLSRGHAGEVLSRLYRLRADRLRHERLMARLRPVYLLRLALVILFLLSLLYAGIVIGTRQNNGSLATWAQFLVASSAGALGSVLAATLKLRDVAELNPFRGVAATALIQPVIGACLGVITWLLLASGIIVIGGSRASGAWQMHVVAAFAGGFSEPFFFRTIERVMGQR
jgi:hypothetical protein